MQLTQSTPLEQSIVRLHTNTAETKEWFYGTVVSILEDDTVAYYDKADRIATAFLSLEEKIAYVKDQIQRLKVFKAEMEKARSIAKEEVAKALGTFGIRKLEGVLVSSITVTPESQTSKTRLEILDEQALIRAGYFTVSLDRDAVEQALYSADQREEVEAYVHAVIETDTKPATIRINKRRTKKGADNTQLNAA